MLDIKLIRTETDRIKKALARRKEEVDIDGLLELDNKRRELLFDVEQKKAQQNVVSKQIPQFKKEGKDTTEIFAQMKELSDSIKADDEMCIRDRRYIVTVWCRRPESNRYGNYFPRDFKSRASASSATPA